MINGIYYDCLLLAYKMLCFDEQVKLHFRIGFIDKEFVSLSLSA